MRRPRVPWLERQSTNRDAIVVSVVAGVSSLILGALDLSGVVQTMPLGAWLAVAIATGSWPVAYRLGSRKTAAETRDFDRYQEHVRDALDILQMALVGEVPNLNRPDFVREGLMEPAATILSQRDRGDVRLSVLAPVPDDAAVFEMHEALGHGPESRRKFRLKISESFAGLAFNTGRVHFSNDTEHDDRFRPHPKSRRGREYRSIVAAPIPRGHEALAVFVVVATESDAFSDVDVSYIAQMGALIGVVNAIVGPIDR